MEDNFSSGHTISYIGDFHKNPYAQKAQIIPTYKVQMEWHICM